MSKFSIFTLNNHKIITFVNMGVIIKQSIKSTIISYVGILIGAFNFLLLFPKYLKPEEFGLIRLLQDIPSLFALFVQLGASSLTDRYFYHFREKQKDNGFLSMLLLYPLIGFTLFLLLFFIFIDFWKAKFASNASMLVDYFIYMVPLTLFIMYTAVMESFLRANLSINWSNFARDVLVRMFYTVFVIVYALKLISFDMLVYLIILGYFISLVTLFIHAKKLKILHLTSSFKFPEKPLMKEMGTYLVYLIPGTAGSLIAQKIDTIMLALIGDGEKNGTTVHNVGLEYIAIYSLAYFISSVIEVPRKSISQISMPILSTALKENDLEKVSSLYKKSSITQYVAGVFIFLMIWINIDDLFVFIPNNELYRQGKYVILFVGISKLFDMATSINGEIIQLSKYFRFNIFTILLLAVLTITLNTIFIPMYAIVGAAIALAITIFLFNAAKTYFIWYRMKLSPFTKGMIPVSLFCLAVLTVTILFPYTPGSMLNSLLWIAGRSLVFCILLYFVVRKFRISEDLNNLIDQVLVMLSNKTGIRWLTKYL